MQQTVTRGTTAFRSRAGLVARQADNVEVGAIEYDSRDAVGSSNVVIVPLRLTIGFVGTGDPDFCDLPLNLNDGYEVQVTVSINGMEQDDGTFCIPAGQNRFQFKRFDVTYPPTPGTHTLSVEVTLPGSETLVANRSFEIETFEDTNGNGGGDGGGDGGVCDFPIIGPIFCGGGEGTLSGLRTFVVLLIVLVVLLQTSD